MKNRSKQIHDPRIDIYTYFTKGLGPEGIKYTWGNLGEKIQERTPKSWDIMQAIRMTAR